MKTQVQSYEKVWQRFGDIDQRLLNLETTVNTKEPSNRKISVLFQERLRMVPNMATGQYFILQLIHRFGFDLAEIASWCELPPSTIFNIYRGIDKRWASEVSFEKLLRFYCAVLRHDLNPTLAVMAH